MATLTPSIQVHQKAVKVPGWPLGFSGDLSVGGVVDEASEVVGLGAALRVCAEEDALDGAVDQEGQAAH